MSLALSDENTLHRSKNQKKIAGFVQKAKMFYGFADHFVLSNNVPTPKSQAFSSLIYYAENTWKETNRDGM